MNPRRMHSLGVALALAMLLIVTTMGLLAVGASSLFELGDGFGTSGSADITGSDGQDGCDWADLFDADPTEEEIAAAVEACGGLNATFLADQLSQGKYKDETVFSGGSNKNDTLIADWRWDTGNVTSKGDVSNFYTYATLNENRELLVFAGLERIDNSGSVHVDFELNQATLSLDKEPPCRNDGTAGPDDGAPCEFVGDKVEGDVLVSMDFVQGGALGILEIRRWDGTTYVPVETLPGEGCNQADSICAYNNAAPIGGGPWPNYDSKGQEITDIAVNGFTEAGINITQVLGSTPCFNTVQAKTRSSASFNSSLQDFGLAAFGVCSLSVTKTAAGPSGEPLSKIGDPVTYTITIENTGAGDLFLESINDSLLGNLTNAALDQGCGTVRTYEPCLFDVVSAVPDESNDPIDSRITAVYSGSSGPDVSAISAVDDTSVELFQPSVDVSKFGDELSAPGNVVSYTFLIANTSSADSPDLVNGSIEDDLLGNLLDPFNPYVTGSDCSGELSVGALCTITAERTVLPDDPDPLGNLVTVHYNPAGGFPNDITDEAYLETDLVHPDLSIGMTSVGLGVVGDLVTYSYTVVNRGDVALSRVSVIDSLLGDVSSSFPAVLAPGQSAMVSLQRTILAGDPDPLTSRVDAVYMVQGLANTLSRFDTSRIELFQPSVDVAKSGDLVSTPGNLVSYTFVITNTGSADSPALVNGSVTDTLLGNLLDAANPYVTGSDCSAILAPAASCTVTAQRTVLDADPDPLPNTVTVSYSPEGFPNIVSDQASLSTDLVRPAFSISVLASPSIGRPGDLITYTYTLLNTGDITLSRISVQDSLLGDVSSSFPTNLLPGQTIVVTLQRAIQIGDPNPLVSEVEAIYQVLGLSNTVVVMVTVDVEIEITCALSPGFWGGGNGVSKWDQPGDPIAAAAGFYTATPFPWLHSSLSGTTYQGILSLSALGDITRQISFKYVAARLNQATFGVPSGTAALLPQIDAYLAAHPVGSDPKGQAANEGKRLLDSLNAYFVAVGEQNCPLPGEF